MDFGAFSLADYPYASLTRRFLNISSVDPEDDAKSAMLLSLRDEKAGITWEQLLEQDAAIILGSAGSGKTTEALSQAERLRSQGIFAFVVRLEALCRQPVIHSFSPYDENASSSFERWKKSGGNAVVFLDALDEARLPDAKNTSVLADALAQLSTNVGQLGRSLKVVLTTRASEWRGSSDLNLVRSALIGMRAQDSREEKPEIKVYRLAKLDTDDIKFLAKSRGVDAEGFTVGINNARAANLASQPLEVHFLLDLWLEELAAGRDPQLIFSSRRRVYGDIVTNRLRTGVDQERRSNLDPIQARYACEKLATAAVISGVRDLTWEQGKQDALFALDTLATDAEQWTEVEVRQLLSSAIFHPSVAGRIRFAHRELEDFLAACHLDRMLRKNAASLEVLSPLLATGLGSKQIPQSTEKVLGWLSSINPTGRKLVTSLRPALLIETGDPTSLSLDEKADALRAQVSLYENRRYRGEWFYHDDIKSFATPDLSPVVRELLASSTSPEVREFLVEVARFGQMGELAVELAAIAMDQQESLRVRTEACSALDELGHSEFAIDVFLAAMNATPPEPENIDAAPNWNMFQIAVLTYAYPQGATVLDAIGLIARLRREARNYSSITSHLLLQFASKLEPEEKPNWLLILLKFASGDRDSQRYQMPAVVPRYKFLAPTIGQLVLDILKANNELEHEIGVLNALEYLFQIDEEPSIERQRTPFQELSEALRPKIALKERLIDRRIQLFDTGQQEARIAFGVLHPLGFDRQNKVPPIFSECDVRTYCEKMKEGSSPREVQLAYECATDIFAKLRNREENDATRLTITVAARRYGGKELRSAYGRLAPFKGFTRRFKNEYRYNIENFFHKSNSDLRKRYYRVRNWVQFFRKRLEIRNGTAVGFLVWAAGKSPNDPGQKTIQIIEDRYGHNIASWFESGFRSYWKNNAIEYRQRNTHGATVGLTGLALEHPTELSQCSTTLKVTAFKYALSSWSGTPSWLEALAVDNADIFVQVASSIIQEDFASDGEPDRLSDGLSRMAYSGADIRNIVARPLFSELSTGTLPMGENLDVSLSIVAKSPAVDVAEVASFLETGFRTTLISFEFSRAWLWLECLFKVDADAAWECWLEAFGDGFSGASKGLFFLFIARDTRSFSKAEDLPKERNDLANNPSILANLVRASYLVWPPEQDIDHEDVYSPGAEERASDRRRHYMNELVRIGSEAALDALDRLISDPRLSEHRDTFLFQRDQMIRNSVRRQNYTIEETVIYLNTLSKPPSTIEEFRQLVKRHLKALLYRLHRSDDDEGYLFRRGGATEDDLRNWLSARLYDVGNDYYTVIREQEVATENRPDLRIHARKKELGRISIEIKLADEGHWPGDLIIEKVDTQLAQQYMHEDASHTGFYLLANAAKPKKKEIDKKTGKVLRKAFAKKVAGKPVDFAGLIGAVEAKAATVTAGLGGDKVVEVISVDLSEK